MGKLYKISVSDWEIQFENGDFHKFDVPLENRIIYRHNFKAINIKIGSYCSEELLEKIQNEKIKLLKEYFDIVDEKSNIIDSLERTYENVILYDISNDSKADGIDTFTFRFHQDLN